MLFSKLCQVATYTSLLLIGSSVTNAAQATQAQLANQGRTVHMGIILFPGFEPLDIIGPLEFIFSVSEKFPIKLYMIADQVGAVSAVPPGRAHMAGPQFLATHTFQNTPKLNILLKPGGMGDISMVEAGNTVIENFIKQRYDELDYLMSVCTGSVSLARAGVLKGKRATTNKRLYNWVTSNGPDANWVPSARWVEDGKVWTSSGVAAGMDMTYAFLKMFYGDTVNENFNTLEYAPLLDSRTDPFAIVHNVTGRDDGNLTSCVTPAGF
ncbi:hypothetical protein TWF506_004518 [Arthrobotrys conoides]|uniref:DJ-1/PfpI domain-containing protein n=1 Tax=Arthrobotrys conoides TaxID=74498 RepID=A0AAN8RIN0_9PEZI